MLTAVPQSPRWGLFTLPPLTRWSRGPVVLLGDAAHAMLPHQGQGANQAIEDAAVLAAELDGATDLTTALRRYHDRRRVRTRQVQAASKAASAALHLPDGPAARQRGAYLAGYLNGWPGSTATTSSPKLPFSPDRRAQRTGRLRPALHNTPVAVRQTTRSALSCRRTRVTGSAP